MTQETIVALVACLVLSRLLLLAGGFIERIGWRVALVSLFTLGGVYGLSLFGNWGAGESFGAFMASAAIISVALGLFDYARLTRRHQREAYRPLGSIELGKGQYRDAPRFILANPHDMLLLMTISGVLAVGCMWAAVDWGVLWIGGLALFLGAMAGAFFAGYMAERDLRRAGLSPQVGGMGRV